MNCLQVMFACQGAWQRKHQLISQSSHSTLFGVREIHAISDRMFRVALAKSAMKNLKEVNKMTNRVCLFAD